MSEECCTDRSLPTQAGIHPAEYPTWFPSRCLCPPLRWSTKDCRLFQSWKCSIFHSACKSVEKKKNHWKHRNINKLLMLHYCAVPQVILYSMSVRNCARQVIIAKPFWLSSTWAWFEKFMSLPSQQQKISIFTQSHSKFPQRNLDWMYYYAIV